MTSRGARTVAVALLAAAGAACAAATPAPTPSPPPAPPAATSPAAASPEAAAAARGHDADARFMQHMMAHHAQALAMTALVPDRAASGDVRLMAERIAVSQTDEIAMMRTWLERHGRPVPDVRAIAAPPASGEQPHAQHHAQPGAAEHAGMPGMLTPAEMARLAAATGAAFDRLFLELMIRHHEGAIAMVAALLGTPGGGQQPEVYQIAAEVDADQRAEIQRMRALLGRLPAG